MDHRDDSAHPLGPPSPDAIGGDGRVWRRVPSRSPVARTEGLGNSHAMGRPYDASTQQVLSDASAIVQHRERGEANSLRPFG